MGYPHVQGSSGQVRSGLHPARLRLEFAAPHPAPQASPRRGGCPRRKGAVTGGTALGWSPGQLFTPIVRTSTQASLRATVASTRGNEQASGRVGTGRVGEPSLWKGGLLLGTAERLDHSPWTHVRSCGDCSGTGVSRLQSALSQQS